MNTNMARLRWFSVFFLHSSALEESSLSIRRVNPFMPVVHCHWGISKTKASLGNISRETCSSELN